MPTTSPGRKSTYQPSRPPPVQPQGQDTDGQHNDNGFDQDPHELVHRTRHRTRLVLNLHQADPCGQGFFDSPARLGQRVPKLNDVSALGHRYSKNNHRFTLVMNLDGRRVDGAALDMGDIAEFQLLARAASDGQCAHIIDSAELTCGANLNDLAGGVDRASALHRVLLTQLSQHRPHV